MSEQTIESEWVPCVKRQDVVLRHRDGGTGHLARCTHQSSSHFAQELAAEDCATCPVRVFTRLRPPGYCDLPVINRDFGEPKVMPNGTLVYPKNGWEPPKVPEGYRRKSDDLKSEDAWTFVPEWPPCIDREMANTVLSCGCIKINAMCASSDSPSHGKQVTVDNCRQCLVRRVLEKVDMQQGAV